MKTLCLSLISFFVLLSCKSKEEIAPNGLVGKWVATGFTQSMSQDSTWSTWRVNPTFAAAKPSIWEFTNNGKFLRDGKPAAECCFAGNRYAVSGNKITFTEYPDCSNVYCYYCGINYWEFSKPTNDTLIIQQCFTRNQFVRVK
ncbi:hypothetical protein VB776_13960 [Arcicella sp. DC2W]|uniref:Lipocalin-like domain-containing protein n=1 Tax=Arcicella gelida TaxID=2984195 RepID=A0ABU5S6E7_9BACT|nr:hypothetical protein [Arcicella sp. DC2W]MEA5404030.1 hypothetical protein [Arcicella sp. DC2W]